MFGMTNKQERFVQEYLIDFNATQAAIRAGYGQRSAYSIGQENLKKPEIQAAIQAKQATIQQRLAVEQEDVVRELIRIGFSNIEDYLQWDSQGNVSVSNFSELSWETKAAVKRFKSQVKIDKAGNRIETFELVLHDKLSALAQLIRYLRPFKNEGPTQPCSARGEYHGEKTEGCPPDLIKKIKAALGLEEDSISQECRGS
ncbi:MAG: terminase small subunit [Nitrospirales bacterium]|nr:terminase small subunit [Nitrospirales bacterium]